MSGNKNNQENHVHECADHEHHCHEDAHGQNVPHTHEHTDEKCAHGDHDHEHDHANCSHHHTHSNHQRYDFSENDLKNFKANSIESLMQQADHFLTDEDFGKVVPIFEIALSKLAEQDMKDSESLLDFINLKQNLAFSYGIIGEHGKAIPLWKSVIEFKEQNSVDYSDLLDDYFGIALSCEQCELADDFLMYIQKGLKLAKENKFDEYVASFEHELGGFYCDLSDFQKSEMHLKNAIKIREKLEDAVGLTMSKMYMGILFEEQKNYEVAKKFYEDALELAKREDVSGDLQTERAELELRLSRIQNSTLKNKLLNL